MHFFRVALTVVTLVCRVHARGYGPATGGLAGISIGGAGGRGGAAGVFGRPGVGGVAGGITGSYFPGSVGGMGVDMSPKPYNVGFAAPDGEGGASFRSEQADGNGAVQGTYGYTDAQGLYRVVEYLADQYGFRAVVNTNEPGVDGKENPADVTMIVGQTPAGIQEQYTVQSGFGVGAVGGRMSGGVGSGRLLGGRPGGYPGSLAGGVSGGFPGGLGGQPGRYPGSLVGGISAGGYPGGRLGNTGSFVGRLPGGFPGGSGGQLGYPGSLAGGLAVGYPGGLSGGYPTGLGGGRITGVGSSGPGGFGSGLAGGSVGAIGGSSGIFSGIPRSTSGKSAY